MKDWNYIFLALSEPFHPNLVSFREGRTTRDEKYAKAMAYVDTREYMNRLDEVLGLQNWSVEYRIMEQPILTSSINEQNKVKYNHTGCIIAQLKIVNPENNSYIIREDIGESENIGNSFYPTASAQAFKRACAALGIGRYLYSLPEKFYPINQYKKFENVEDIRKDLLYSSKHYSPENINRAYERILRLMHQAVKHEKFELPQISIFEMNYYDLIEYGKKLKLLVEE